MSINDVLVALGAKAVRDPSSKENVLALDLELLEVRSIFGGVLKGEAIVHVSSREAFAFQRPLELAHCGTLWLPGVESVEALSQAIVEAHDTLRARLQDDQMSLRKLGLKPGLVSPEPCARAIVDLAGKEAHVAIDENGDLVLEKIAGQGVPSEHGRVYTPADVNEIEAIEGLEQHVKMLVQRGIIGAEGEAEHIVGAMSPASGDDVDIDVDVSEDEAWGSGAAAPAPAAPETQATRNLSDSQLAELQAALGEDSDDGVNEVVDASEEGTPHGAGSDDGHTAAGVEAEAVHAPVDPADSVDPDDEDPTVSVPARSSSLLQANAGAEESGAHQRGGATDCELALSIDEDDSRDEPTVSAPGSGAARTLSEKGAPPWAAQAAAVAPERESVQAGIDEGEGAVSPRATLPRPASATIAHMTLEEPPTDVPTKGTVSQLGEDPLPSAVFCKEDAWEDDLDALVGRLSTAPPASTLAVTAPARARGGTTLDVELEQNRAFGIADAEQLDTRAAALEEGARALRERALKLRAQRPAMALHIDAAVGTSTSLRVPASMAVDAISLDDGPMPAADVGRSPSVATAGAATGRDDVPHEGVALTQLQASPVAIASLSGKATHVRQPGGGRHTDLKNAPHVGDSGLGGIGLVVADPRARELMKKHLTPHFRRLVEAPDAMTAASLPEALDVEALVFVRPKPDEATCKGIVRLCDGPRPPRILVISSDVRFDEMHEVSLRLPLGQRASEVAQQVLDGLSMLGVDTLAADS